VKKNPPDLLLLDLMLPKLSGWKFARKSGASSPEPAAHPNADGARREADRVIGLEMGADDYVTKPFSRASCVARVKALLPGAEPAGETARTIAAGG